MNVGDIIELAKISALANLSIVKNEAAVIKLIYLGVSELYSSFNLSIKVESIETHSNLALYELRDEDVNMLLKVYNCKGQQLEKTDAINEKADYKIINYRSFLLNNPREDLLFAVYKASPKMFTSDKDRIDLPNAMIDALLSYLGYLAHSAINTDGVRETSAYLERYELARQKLENQGYKVSINNESIGLIVKGFI
jgi:hypothetical protein